MFAGILSFQQSISAWGDPDKILSALAPYSLDKPRDIWSTARQMLLQVSTRTGSTTAEIYQHLESGIAVAFWGRLDNRPDLIAQLDAAHKASDDELIALAWLKWGELCPEKLIGDFAFAVASPKNGTVFLARDVMGVKPLHYRIDEHGVFFANSAAAFKPLKLGMLTPSQEWMAKYLLEIPNSHTETAFLEIQKLPGAHSLLIHADGRMNILRYHRFLDDAPVERTRDPRHLEAYRAIWQESVSCRIPASGMIGTENSGGLDSGSITAELARQLGAGRQRLYSMGYCFAPLEPEYILSVAMHCRLMNNFICSGYDEAAWQKLMPLELNISGYPQEHSDGTSYSLFYEECKRQGIGSLYSGFGGDEVATNFAGSLRMELFDRRDFSNLWRILPGNPLAKAGRFAKSIYRGAQRHSVQSPAIRELEKNWRYHLADPEMVEKYNLKEQYFSLTRSAQQFRRVNDFAFYQINHANVPARFESCTLSAAAYGVEYLWPFWDQRLVQQWLSTPSIWKVGVDGIGRNLHRQAVAGVCPGKVTWKLDKDVGFEALDDEYDKRSNRVLFEELLSVCENMPAELDGVVDKSKALSIAKQGLLEDWRGAIFVVIVEAYVQRLQALTAWLQTHRHA